MCNEVVINEPEVLVYIPDQYITQEMCNSAVSKIPWVLKYVPDQYITQEMCNSAVINEPEVLVYVPEHYITQEMCNTAVFNDPEVLEYIPDQYKTQEMCEDAVFKNLMVIRFVPDWIISHITESVLELIEEDRDALDEEEVEEVERIIWGNIHRNKFYQLSKDLFQFHHKRKYFKSLQEELIAIAWHPDR